MMNDRIESKVSEMKNVENLGINDKDEEGAVALYTPPKLVLLKVAGTQGDAGVPDGSANNNNDGTYTVGS